MASGSYISMAASKSRPPITACRRAGSDDRSTCSGMSSMFASSIPTPAQLLREHVRQKRGWYRIQKEDHPKKKPLRVSQLLWRASRAGSHIGTLCDLIYTQ